MKTKYCPKCKETKPLSEFHKAKNGKYGVRGICKICIKLRNLEYHKKAPWKRCLNLIKQRCYNKNHDAYYRYGKLNIKCFITEEELKELWFRDKAYLMEKPSIDRIDNDGNYIYDNCQFIEMIDNIKKMHRETGGNKRAILQFDKDMNFIKKWNSIKEASLMYCLKGKTKSSGGFIWKYQDV